VLTKVEAQGTPQERTTTTTWDTTWSYLPKTVTTPDNTTTYAYDGQGRLLSTTVHSTKE
jgi:YD repeat-containing protein